MRQTLLVCCSLWLAGCGGPESSTPPPALPPPSLSQSAPQEYPGLHQVVAFDERLWSGSVPHGAEGFASLAALGVRTIISVDGAQPDAALARTFGLRTIHLPIAYGGIADERKLELAAAFARSEGPVYLHCHHGKHRSAGAAAAITVQLGLLSAPEATARMEVAGTSPAYPGLFACAQSPRLTSAQLATVGDDFPECTPVSSMVQAMLEADLIAGHLQTLGKAGWQVPPDHPDLVPAAEAGRLVDVFRQLRDVPAAQAQDRAFAELLTRQIDTAQALEDGLVDGADAALLAPRWQAARQICRDCHAAYRNR